MAKFKLYVIADCVSFTVLMLLYTVLSMIFDFAGIVPEAVLLLFLMTTCIAVLMSFTDKIPLQNFVLKKVVDLIDIIAVVFLIGGTTGFIPMELPYMAVVLAMIGVVYLATFAVIAIKAKAEAEDINKQIRKMKQEQ